MPRLHPSLQGQEFTLDGIIFPPLKIPDFEVSEIDISSYLTKEIRLKVPLMSSPMDTVTGHEMAILMALQGGIGVIHYNYPTVEDQMKEVEMVRKYEAGFVLSPEVLGPDTTVGELYALAQKTGFFSYPITKDGTLKTALVGIVTHRDVRYREDPKLPLRQVMTPLSQVITVNRRDTLDKKDVRAANKVIRKHNLDTLPIVDDNLKVVALVTDSDLTKDQRYPLATKDNNKQLKVLVAVESRLAGAKERIARAAAAGASGIVVDARNIYRDHLEIARFTKQHYPHLSVILGNVVTPEVIKEVMKQAGDYVAAFRVGIGTGEVCTTTEALGIGRALGVAIHEVEAALRPFEKKFGHIGIIGDGGIKSPHHILGALMLGADAIMMGTELAGLEESPPKAQWDQNLKRMVKKVRGMGSPGAIQDRQGTNRYMVSDGANTRFPEGIEKPVSYKGAGKDVIQLLFAGVRQAMHGLGLRNIGQLQREGYIVPRIPPESKGLS